MANQNVKNESVLWVSFFEQLLKRLPLILLITFLFGLLGCLGSRFLITPTYRANAQLIVNAREQTAQNITSEQLNTAETLAEIYGIIIKSDTVLEQTISDLKLDLDYDELASKVSVEAVNATSVLRISVKDQDQETAKRILQSILKIAPDVIKDKVDAGSVKVISEPRLESRPISPNILRSTVLSALIGLMLASAALLLWIVRNDTVTGKQQFEERLDLSVLGEVPSVERRGATALLSDQSSFAYKEAYRYLQTNVNLLAASNDQKAIVITSSVSGEGKTTISINLAKALAAAGKKVILMECDLRMPSVSKLLGLTQNRERNGLRGLLSGECVMNDAMIEKDGFFVIPSGGTADNSVELLGSKKMNLLLDLLKEQFDYIILDTPPAGELADAIALSSSADCMLLVARESYADMKTIQNTFDHIRQSDVHILGAVLNFCKQESGGLRRGRYDRYYYSKYAGKERRKN